MAIANIINNAFGTVAGFVEEMNKKDGWKRLGEWLRTSLTTAVANIDADTVAEAIGGSLKGILDTAIEFFGNTNDWTTVGNKIGEILGKIDWAGIWVRVIGFIGTAWLTAQVTFWAFLDGIFKGIGETITENLGINKEKIQNGIDDIKKAVGIKLLKVANTVAETWDNIKKWWEQNVAPKLKLSYWQTKLEPIKKAVGSVFKGAANTAIDFINGMIAAMENALNKIVKKINSLHIVNPFNGQEIWSPSVPLFDFARIPHLAKGGVVAKPTQAIIGEAGREAVMPLDNNTEWMDLLAEKLSQRGTSENITIRFTGSTAQLVRLLKPELEKEDKRTGKRLIVGGAY